MGQALDVLNDCLAETRRTGMRRSGITALSLLGEWHLIDGSPQQAMAFSEQAVDRIRDAGWQVPAASVEEVLYRHSRIQRALGNESGAREFIDRAATEVLRKADSLDGEARSQFLQEVRLNRSILADAP